MKLALALLATLASCASITRGTTDTLIVESDPPGAMVALSTGVTGKTPTSFVLPRKDKLTLTIQRAGYEPVSVDITPQIVGEGGAGMAGNIFFGGLIGAAIDASSGAMNDLKPNPVHVTLKRCELTLKQRRAIAELSRSFARGTINAAACCACYGLFALDAGTIGEAVVLTMPPPPPKKPQPDILAAR